MSKAIGIYILLIALIVINSQNCPQQVLNQQQLATLDPECFRKVYDSDKHDGHRLSRIINQRISSYKRLLQDIKMNDVEHLKTHPVIKWAQSDSQIFLNLRLSHRHDSPTCSDIRYQKISTDVEQIGGDFEISKIQKNPDKNNSRLTFSSECFFTHQKLLFNLDLQFNSTLTKLTVKKQGFGRYTVVGQKQNLQIWTHPFTDSKNAGIWSEMRNKYSTDMDKYFQLLQQLLEKQRQKPKRRFKNKKAQKQFETGQL